MIVDVSLTGGLVVRDIGRFGCTYVNALSLSPRHERIWSWPGQPHKDQVFTIAPVVPP